MTFRGWWICLREILGDMDRDMLASVAWAVGKYEGAEQMRRMASEAVTKYTLNVSGVRREIKDRIEDLRIPAEEPWVAAADAPNLAILREPPASESGKTEAEEEAP